MLKIEDVKIKRGDFVFGPVKVCFEKGATGIIGPNGSGKSTLLRAIVGLLKLNEGSIFLDDKNINKLNDLEYASYFSYIPQELPDNVEFSVGSFVKMGNYRKKRKYYDIDRNLYEEALSVVDLSDKAEIPFNSLSGGEKRRAFIAQAIVQDSEWILMDEPASFLDYKHNLVMIDIIKHMIEEKNKSILIVSHDCNFLTNITNELAAFKSGRFVKKINKNELFQEDFLSSLFDVPFNIIESKGKLFLDYSQV